MTAAVTRMLTPAQAPAWHVVGHAEAKSLLADERIGMSHPDPAKAAWYATDDVSGRPRGGSETEYLEHAEWRRAMTKVFSPAKLAAAAASTAGFADDILAGLRHRPQPVDLNAEYAIPLCSRIIFQVLDVPDSELQTVQGWTDQGATTGDVDRSLLGMKALLSFATRLVRERRDGDGADAVSELIRAGRAGGSGGDGGRVVKLVAGMLAFGRETPASALSNGIVLLLRQREQRDLLRADRALVAGAVEEILRMFHPPAATPHGLLRYAHADVESGGEHIAKGDMVLIDIARANFDQRTFADPERFDITRSPNPHLTFGSGFYMCNFAKLARLELAAALDTLFERLPGLELAVPAEELRHKTHLRTRAIEALPVTW
ncbi:cytochrome P450 [Plantactinospora sp. WMMC1484]|uniref:cytochrome P450 n=1 Tax=Plantactinospora sp. WMMC1484 TaxID=3404122 RepID=UPI003BF5B57A